MEPTDSLVERFGLFTIIVLGEVVVGIEHAGDGRNPAPTAWLVGGAAAGVALSIALLTFSLNPHPARRAVPYTIAAAALGALVVAAARPAPWLLALLLTSMLSAVWFEGFLRHARNGVTITDRV